MTLCSAPLWQACACFRRGTGKKGKGRLRQFFFSQHTYKFNDKMFFLSAQVLAPLSPGCLRLTLTIRGLLDLGANLTQGHWSSHMENTWHPGIASPFRNKQTNHCDTAKETAQPRYPDPSHNITDAIARLKMHATASVIIPGTTIHCESKAFCNAQKMNVGGLQHWNSLMSKIIDLIFNDDRGPSIMGS